MKPWDKDNDDYWYKSGPSFNLDDENRKYKLEEMNKFSMRSTKPVAVASNAPNMKSYQNVEPLSFSIKAENDLQCPELYCHGCQRIIVDSESYKYEGNKVFTNEKCWREWIDKMIKSGEIQFDQLCSLASKKYCLDSVCASCNGQLILKVVLSLRGVMQPFEFGSLLYENTMAYNHYLSFLKETHQTDDKLLRCKYEMEEAISKLRIIFSDNANVGETTVNHYMTTLSEFRDERLLNLKMPLQCEMIKEYVGLLNWQKLNSMEFINAPLIETLISNQVSYKAIKDVTKARLLKDTFKLTAEEFLWTAMKSIAEENKVAEIDNICNNKLMGSKPDVPMQRIVAYLVFLNKDPDEIKMKCLAKISDIADLVDCANKWKLLPAYIDYCKQNKDNGQLKKIQQVSQGKR